MTSPLRRAGLLLFAGALAGSLSGCVLDRTGQSATEEYKKQMRMHGARIDNLEKQVDKMDAKLAELDEGARHRRMVELNVLKQVRNLSRTPVIQHAWDKGKRPMLHGFVYDLADGLLDPLVVGVECKPTADGLNDLWGAAATNRMSRERLLQTIPAAR